MPKFCKTETFDFTSHCDGDDVIELKARMNPDVIPLIHGDSKKTKKFVEDHPNEGFIAVENDKPITL